MSAVPNRGAKPHVLVADDSKVIRKAVSKILGNDFELIEAEDGESAWDQLGKDRRIEVLMTDIEMPRLDGYGLICRVRAADHKNLRELPIIVITGAEDDVTRERAYACGATDFITKPIDGVQLLARARAHAKLDEAVRKLGEMESTLEQQTSNDPLTQLRSQRYIFERGEQDLAFAKRRGTELSVVRLDVDNFRALYDAHGDDVCNQLIIWVAKIVQSCVRTEDTAARMRGAHFAVLMPGTAPTSAAVVAERIRTSVAAKPFSHAGVTVTVTISVGLVTLGRDNADNFNDLMHTAERNLTLAKADGGNRLSIGYNDAMHVAEEAVIEQPDMETAVKLIEKNEGGKLLPYLPELTTRLVPFLELANRNLDLDIAEALQTIKDKLRSMK
jgi:two-component system, cell cycle response regulator